MSDSATLAVRIGDIWFTSYFFDPSEIEFTFDPRDVVDESGFAAVESFVRRMGNACGKRVVMTMESWTDHVALPAMLEYRHLSGSVVDLAEGVARGSTHLRQEQGGRAEVVEADAEERGEGAGGSVTPTTPR
ncbi:hypothetical protein [Streptomyces sp. PmtA]|uniref:hypothetical protein n=1 Tax=Streptomyces sp. PmtA TaxID=3074275 RepID=UPI003014F0FC